MSVFAADITPSVTVQYKYGNSKSDSFSLSSSNASYTGKVSGYLSYTSGTVAVDNYSGSTTVFELSHVPSDFSVSTSSPGYSVSYSLSDGTATIIVTADSSRESNLCGLDFSGKTYVGVDLKSYVLGSGYSYTGSGTSPEPGTPSGSMNGIQGWRYALSSAYEWETYNQYIGVRKIMYSLASQGPDGGTDWNSSQVEGEEILFDMAVAMSVNGYKWKVDATTGELVFYGYDGGMAKPGTWLDMVFRYLTYDYYWGTRLWSNDVSGSWYGSISNSFSYLNFRVNQILEVLANDADLKIKEATDEERQWVQDYFEGSGDKADSSKYDDLNNTGSAFKDVFQGAPDTSIADGFSTVNDNGYDFWSQSVSDDINGASSTSVFRAPVSPDQRIVDAYSANWAQIVGGYYD